jgi:hypothetical protein
MFMLDMRPFHGVTDLVDVRQTDRGIVWMYRSYKE